MKYKYEKENGWVQPIRKKYRLMCCDCGLVHEMDFRLIKTKRGSTIQFRVRRNERATWASRRNCVGIKFVKKR